MRHLVPIIFSLPMLLCSGCDPEKAKEGDDSSTAGSPRPWLTEVAKQVGLGFFHETGAAGAYRPTEVLGGGVALFDYDGDGDLDAYFINGRFEEPSATPPDEEPVNRMFRQESDGTFSDVTAESGLGDGHYGMGVSVGDIDNDGDLDLYVTNEGPDQLFRNDGSGRFVNITRRAGVHVPGWSTSAAFIDYDRDGLLDLYVAQYLKVDPAQKCYDLAGRLEFCGPKMMPSAPDVLLHNEGDGAFREASREAGIQSISSTGLGVVSADFDNDGWMDVYVTNDAFANQLWINQGNGTFRDDAPISGVAYNWLGGAEAGMGVVAADFDNDLDLDLFMTHLTEETNTFYRNLGPGMGFSDVTGEVNLADSSSPYTGFGTAAFDVDLDGDLDLAVVNGKVMRGHPIAGADVTEPWKAYAEPNLFYLNDGTGRFEPGGAPVQSFCDPVVLSRGLAVGDIDNDGDLDMLVGNIQHSPFLYRNDAPRRGRWLMVRAWDSRLKRDAIGARITVRCGTHSFLRTVHAGDSFLSSSDQRVHFGLGDVTTIDRVNVRWPDGLEEQFSNVAVDAAVRLVRGEGRPVEEQ